MRNSPVLIALTINLCFTDASIAEVDYDEVFVGGTFLAVDDAKEVLEKDPNLPDPTVRIGVVVASTIVAAPIGQAKIKPLDIITKVGRKPIKTVADLRKEIRTTPSGEEMKWTVFRAKRITGKRFAWRKAVIPVTPVTRREFYQSSVQLKRDDFRETDYYYFVDTPKVGGPTHIAAYFVATDGVARRMYLRCHLRRAEWLFVRSIDFKIGDEVIKISPSYNDVTRDNSGGRVWEWYNAPVEGEVEKLVKLLSDEESGDVTVRFVGSDYVQDHDLSDTERHVIHCVWHAYLLSKENP